MTDLSDDLDIYDPIRRANAHINTLDRFSRYCFDKEELSEKLEGLYIENEELLYQTDGLSAVLDGDILSTDSRTVENAAAFLEEELENSTEIWIYKLETAEERYGFTAAYGDTQSSYERLFNRPDKATSLLHIFEPVERSEQVDIYLERADSNSILQDQ